MSMELDKIKKVKLHSEVARIIESYIRENNLSSGDKLPPERVLAEKLGIGRSSLREALRVLEAQGVLEVISGKGIFAGSREEDSESLEEFSRQFNKKVTLLELYQIRRPLGALSAGLAASNATEEQIQELEHYLREYEKEYNQGRPGREPDRAFHMAMHNASGNSLLVLLFTFIFKNWDSFEFGVETAFPDSFPLHISIFEAIRDRDPRAAEKAYHALMDYVESRIMELMGEKGEFGE
jgi:DNA-binding FadR family transcriptional regulator